MPSQSVMKCLTRMLWNASKTLLEIPPQSVMKWLSKGHAYQHDLKIPINHVQKCLQILINIHLIPIEYVFEMPPQSVKKCLSKGP